MSSVKQYLINISFRLVIFGTSFFILLILISAVINFFQVKYDIEKYMYGEKPNNSFAIIIEIPCEKHFKEMIIWPYNNIEELNGKFEWTYHTEIVKDNKYNNMICNPPYKYENGVEFIVSRFGGFSKENIEITKDIFKVKLTRFRGENRKEISIYLINKNEIIPISYQNLSWDRYFLIKVLLPLIIATLLALRKKSKSENGDGLGIGTGIGDVLK